MRLRRIHLELDAGVLLFGVMLWTVTLHSLGGTILNCWTLQQPLDDPAKYVGTLPYQWIDPRDHRKVRAAIASAASGRVTRCRYMLEPSLYKGLGWCVETRWEPTGSKERPLVGFSQTYTAILTKLTAKERALCRELGDPECNKVLHEKKSTAHRVAKTRLARKLGISTAQLPAFCAAYASVLS